MAIQKPREIAVRVLQERERGEDFVENIFERELGNVLPTSSRQTSNVLASSTRQSPDRRVQLGGTNVRQASSLPSAARLSPVDRALCQELVYGICRWQQTLDWLIARKTEGRAQKPDLEILLRLGLYQMFWLDRIPNHAAVHETVELAKKMGLVAQSGFINAVLRGYTREREQTEKLLEQLKTSEPAIGFSHPYWLYQKWVAQFGEEKIAALMTWNNTPPKTFVRVNTIKSNFGPLKPLWEIEGVKYTAHSFDWVDDKIVFEVGRTAPRATRVADEIDPQENSRPAFDFAKMKSFQKGFFYVQDPSTLLAVHELNPQPGETILDLCSAPGGKTTYIAQLMQNRGKIMAQDSDADRLALVRENVRRLGITCIETSLAPRDIIEKPSLKFDRILIDAPCSNTGVMRRRVDLRWRILPEEIARLRETQLGLLRRAAPRLKPGGTLIYSTCSLEPEENQEVVQQFLEEQKNFRLEKERELLPFVDGVDGAFVAKLILKSEDRNPKSKTPEQSVERSPSPRPSPIRMGEGELNSVTDND